MPKKNNPGCKCCFGACGYCIVEPYNTIELDIGTPNWEGNTYDCDAPCLALSGVYSLSKVAKCVWEYRDDPFCTSSGLVYFILQATMQAAVPPNLREWSVRMGWIFTPSETGARRSRYIGFEGTIANQVGCSGTGSVSLDFSSDFNPLDANDPCKDTSGPTFTWPATLSLNVTP